MSRPKPASKDQDASVSVQGGSDSAPYGRSQLMGMIVALRCIRFGLVFSGVVLSLLLLVPQASPRSAITFLSFGFLFGIYLILIGTLLTLGRCSSPRARGVLLLSVLGSAAAWSLLQGPTRFLALSGLFLFWTQGLLFEAKLSAGSAGIAKKFAVLQIAGAGTLSLLLLLPGAIPEASWFAAAVVYLILLLAVSEWLRNLRHQNRELDSD